MTRVYSKNLRLRVLADCDTGMSIKHRVCHSWVRQLKQRRRESGEITPRPSNPWRVPVTKVIHASEQNRPDIRLAREQWRTHQVGLDLVLLKRNGFFRTLGER